MKKKLLFGFILCSLTAALPAQQKDTIMVQPLPNICKIEVRNNAHLILRSGPQNEVITIPNQKVKVIDFLNDWGEVINNQLVLDQPCQYHLTLADTSLHLVMKDSAFATIIGMDFFPFNTIDLMHNAELQINNFDTLSANSMVVRMQHASIMRVKSPFYVHKMDMINSSTDTKYLVETNDYHVDKYHHQFLAQNIDTLNNAGFVKITASSGGDTSVFVADKLNSKSDWEHFFKELGGGLYELSNLWNGTPDTSAKKKTATTPDTSALKPKRWTLGFNWLWSFMYWNGEMSAFSNTLNYWNTPSDDHITFSSLSFEFVEHYWINKQHALKLGIGMAWDNYRFKNPINTCVASLSGNDRNKSKYVAEYITVPIGYQFKNTNCRGFSLELLPGYVFNGYVKTKQITRIGADKTIFKQKQADMAHLNTFKLDARVTVQFPWGAVYAQPSLLPVLGHEGEKKVYPVRVGFAFDLYDMFFL